MKRGIVQLIPLIAIAAAVSIGSIGVLGSLRSKTISTSSVLSSSAQSNSHGNGQGNKNEGNDSLSKNTKSGNQGSQSDKKPDTSSADKSNNNGEKPNNTKVSELKSTDLELNDDINSVSGGTGGISELEGTPSIRPGNKIRTNFPITINPLTNEKTVTTPGGVKTIILPSVAIQNMIKAGFPVVIPPDEGGGESTPSATPEGTPSGATESGELEVDSEADILLTEVDGQLVYEIPAVKDEKFLGVLGVKIKVKGIVSAEDGAIIKLQKSFFDNILDFFSF